MKLDIPAALQFHLRLKPHESESLRIVLSCAVKYKALGNQCHVSVGESHKSCKDPGLISCSNQIK